MILAFKLQKEPNMLDDIAYFSGAVVDHFLNTIKMPYLKKKPGLQTDLINRVSTFIEAPYDADKQFVEIPFPTIVLLWACCAVDAGGNLDSVHPKILDLFGRSVEFAPPDDGTVLPELADALGVSWDCFNALTRVVSANRRVYMYKYEN